MFQIKTLYEPIGMMSELLFGLVIENKEENPFITGPIHQSFLEGKFDKVPILIGFNTEEILFFSSGRYCLITLSLSSSRSPPIFLDFPFQTKSFKMIYHLNKMMVLDQKTATTTHEV